jgi:hypothetical protein
MGKNKRKKDGASILEIILGTAILVGGVIYLVAKDAHENYGEPNRANKPAAEARSPAPNNYSTPSRDYKIPGKN